MEYQSFDAGHAKAYGLKEAVIINILQSKVRYGRDFRKLDMTIHFNITAESLAQDHDYHSVRDWSKALASLVKQGVLERAGGSDWYAFADQENFISTREGSQS
jgi:hypothetical protein